MKNEAKQILSKIADYNSANKLYTIHIAEAGGYHMPEGETDVARESRIERLFTDMARDGYLELTDDAELNTYLLTHVVSVCAYEVSEGELGFEYDLQLIINLGKED